jgi:type I restriction enzyme M protein
MLVNKLRNDIDNLWTKFWQGGISNPLTVIEQISYLIFARMLDIQEDMAERKAHGKEFERLFPSSKEGQLLRWKNFKNMPGEQMLQHLKTKVFPFFTTLGQSSSKGEAHVLAHLGEYMKDAALEIKNPTVLVEAVNMIERLPLSQSDIKGDIYEYLLSKLTTAGINGQFRTPRHIIDTMIAMIDPQPTDKICDPACGTAGFLVRTMEYLNKQYSSKEGTFEDEEGHKHYSGDLLEPYRKHISNDMFWGFDFDTTMLRVASMNMLLHSVSGANILFQDSLNKSVKQQYPQQEENFFDVVLANPPFKGAIDEKNTNPDVLDMVRTKKTELLFVAHIMRSLNLGGKAAVIVPAGVLFGSSSAHRQLRQALLENNQLEGIVNLPSGVFRPYAGVSTAILLFSKGGETERVWFYDLQADGYSLDDKRNRIDANDLPDALAQWQVYKKLVDANSSAGKISESFGDKTKRAFVLDVKEIISNNYDLSINRYKEVKYKEKKYDDPKCILKQLMDLEDDIQKGLQELEKML